MKLAVLLFGLSKCEYHHWSLKKNVLIDYNESYNNYKKYIFDFFKNKGYDIDIYFSTNLMNNEDKQEIINKYQPLKYNFIKNNKDKIKSRNIRLNHVIDLCLTSKIEYDLVLITRFDLLFKKDFENSNIDYDKFNLVSILQRPELICDNFYLFPYKYLIIFSNIVKKNLSKSFHRIQKDLYEKFNIENINYINNENCVIAALSFYKIIRTIKNNK